MHKPRGLFILDLDTFPLIYGEAERRDIAKHVDFVAPPQTRESIAVNPRLLNDVEALFSGWGPPILNEAFLDSAPKLEVVFYGGGAVGGMVTESVWSRGIRVTSAYAANSIPVAEYTLAMILFSLKHGWSLTRETRLRQTFVPRNGAPGCYGSTVGLISMGAVSRCLLPLLRHFDLNIVVFDPFLSSREAASLGVTLVSLEELFKISDVVSLHTPELPETKGMITGQLLSSMLSGATFINTARGSIVRETEMLDVLQNRPDLQAILDVTDVEPPPQGSPFYMLPNVILTPHIAGSVGNECKRMGRYMVEELERYIAGKPLKWEITPQFAARSSHRPTNCKKCHPVYRQPDPSQDAVA